MLNHRLVFQSDLSAGGYESHAGSRRRGKFCCRSIRQHCTDLTQSLPLFVVHDQKLYSTLQAFFIPHHGSQLHRLRSERYGKRNRNHLADLQLATENRPEAELAEVVAATRVHCRLDFAEHRYLNMNIIRITGEPPLPTVYFGGRFYDAQSDSSSSHCLATLMLNLFYRRTESARASRKRCCNSTTCVIAEGFAFLL